MASIAYSVEAIVDLIRASPRDSAIDLLRDWGELRETQGQIKAGNRAIELAGKALAEMQVTT